MTNTHNKIAKVKNSEKCCERNFEKKNTPKTDFPFQFEVRSSPAKHGRCIEKYKLS